MSASPAPIGLFDSGIGGLSILREVRTALPNESLIYVADQAHVPYGPRPRAEIARFSHTITSWLLSQGCKLVVVACNTASAAALHDLRAAFPGTPFVGMEPAVKPAVQQSRTGVVAVLATPTTLNGEMYTQLVARYSQGVRVIAHEAPGLVDAIEAGMATLAAQQATLTAQLAPLLAQNIDTLVLGCTHYPFAARHIQAIVGPGVTLVDPAPAIARQVRRVLDRRDLRSAPDTQATTHYFTTGNVARFCGQVRDLLGEETPLCSGLTLSSA